jgi:L-threonylcarbamoyladenylate synthase
MTERLKPEEVERAAHLLRTGCVVAFPTETVYGLGAAIFNPGAIEKIFSVKGRPADNPLIAHVCDFAQIEKIAIELQERFYVLAERFFPGPLTLVVKKHPAVPLIVSGGRETVALRMPKQGIARALIAALGEPIVAPSANLSGKPSATDADHVLEDFDGKISAVIEGGRCELGIESTVLSLLQNSPVLLRPGTIRKQELEEALGCAIQEANAQTPLASPGMKYRHYCPNAPVHLFHTPEALCVAAAMEKRPMVLSRKGCVTACPGDHFTLDAYDLYALFRLADKQKYSSVLILDEGMQEDTALLNRLQHSLAVS